MSLSRLETLSHLQEYANASAGGHDDLKSCLWQVTKSQRNQNRSMLRMSKTVDAAMLREELCAQSLLRQTNEKEAGLVEEDEVTASATKKTCRTIPVWKLVDTAADARSLTSTTKVPSPCSNSSGLRQRKKNNDDKNEWTLVEEADAKIPTAQDPLELFGGLPTRELKLAQQKAKEALANYVQAANHAAVILRMIDDEKERK